MEAPLLMAEFHSTLTSHDRATRCASMRATGNGGGRTEVQYEGRFVGVSQILSIEIEMDGILERAYAAILQCVANSCPWLRPNRRHEASWASS